jgi:AraC family transcriptional regulator, regulatory protein of adaptative response / DNA-3-methyladenine glycosylase II
MLAPPLAGSGDRELRGAGVNGAETARHHVRVIALELAARPPFDGTGVLRWLEARLVPGVEELSGGVYRRTLRLAGGPGVVALEPRGDHVGVTLRLTDPADADGAVAACRDLFDLDADPAAHNPVLAGDAALAPAVAANPGLRAPGTVDPSETAVRAVLGQQVSLAAARTLAGRLVGACGTPLPEPDGALTHTFPAPEQIDPDVLGMPETRRGTLRALCDRLGGGAPMPERDELLAIPGVGPWTADYIALRALGGDAFPASDLGLRRGACALGLPDDARGLAARAERWRPWRRYAAHHLWAA